MPIAKLDLELLKILQPAQKPAQISFDCSFRKIHKVPATANFDRLQIKQVSNTITFRNELMICVQKRKAPELGEVPDLHIIACGMNPVITAER